MAVRPVFCVDEALCVRSVETQFEYSPGFAKSQRQKNVTALHAAFLREHPGAKLLEISGFSDVPEGAALSAFALPVGLPDGRRVSVECAFQAGKVFENGGPYTDLLAVPPGVAKRDPRLTGSGRVIGFRFGDLEFPARPSTLFYTWLYLRALTENPDLAALLTGYDGFTDVAFNPKRSINCQAYAAAVYVRLIRAGTLDAVLADPGRLAALLAPSAPIPSDPVPGKGSFPSVFRKYDAVIHPDFGRGMVQKVVAHPKRAELRILFDGAGEKTLDESWVRLHCKYDASGVRQAPDPDDAGRYPRVTDLRLTDGRYAHHQAAGGPMNARMVAALQLAEQFSDGEIGFAVIGDDVLVMLGRKECASFAEAERQVRLAAGKVRSRHPDFTVISLEKAGFLVEMHDRAVCAVPNETGAEDLELAEALIARQHILDACRRPVVYGFALPVTE